MASHSSHLIPFPNPPRQVGALDGESVAWTSGRAGPRTMASRVVWRRFRDAAYDDRGEGRVGRRRDVMAWREMGCWCWGVGRGNSG